MCSSPSRFDAPHLPYSTDTGIDVNHPAFEGRASWGKTFGPWEDKDKDGHGTHCAGIAISGPYGVAKASKVIAVKVMNGRNDGTASQLQVFSPLLVTGGD